MAGFTKTKTTNHAFSSFFSKQKAIETLDKFFEHFRNPDRIFIVICDHITSTLDLHKWRPVHFLIYGKGGKGKVSRFDEFSVKKGKLKLMRPIKFWRFVSGM